MTSSHPFTSGSTLQKRPFLCGSSFGPLRHLSTTPLFSLAGGCMDQKGCNLESTQRVAAGIFQSRNSPNPDNKFAFLEIPGATRTFKGSYTPARIGEQFPHLAPCMAVADPGFVAIRVLIHDLRLAMMPQSQVPRFFSGKARGGVWRRPSLLRYILYLNLFFGFQVLSLSSTENCHNTQEGFLVRTQQLKKRSSSRGRRWVSYGNVISGLGCSLLPASFVSRPGFRLFSSVERRIKGFHRGQ
ncbi:hypothetical protein EDB89DRAFT_329742 [Lactarius sanguifluus]|nr:hypothetical protein EDB89DRAFT_329742 [Lactarius sanguifluus]